MSVLPVATGWIVEGTGKQRFCFCLRLIFGLPRASDVVGAELICVAGPLGRAVESATCGAG